MNAIVNPSIRAAAPPASAVSWAAILAGAAAAAALSLVLLILGTGLGLTAISPWTFDRSTAAALGVSTIIWISVTQLLASGLGGYLAGRLRTKWADVLADEVYFRDTAHGFLAWCVASLATAAVLTSVVGSIVGGGLQAGAAVAGGAAAGAAASAAGAATAAGAEAKGDSDSLPYFVDSLFRTTGSVSSEPNGSDVQPPPDQPAANAAEVGRIFANGVRNGSLPDDDVRYLGRVIAERTGLDRSAAEQRVRDTFAGLQTALREAEEAAKAAADEAREASAYSALWLVVSLLIGAFFASLMATFGGRQRDL